MEITTPTNFQDVRELTRLLSGNLDTQNRFSIEIPETDACNAVYSSLRAEVIARGGRLDFDDATRAHVIAAAKWLNNPSGKPGLMFCGSPGNGKTTLANAVGHLIEYFSEKELGRSRRLQKKLVRAKEVCNTRAAGERFKELLDDYRRLFDEPLLIIDDLGEEPKEVLVYGMPQTPIIDLLAHRYERRLMTIITTNLKVRSDDAGEVTVRSKYGERIYDRIKEMCDLVVFNNPSFRR